MHYFATSPPLPPSSPSPSPHPSLVITLRTSSNQNATGQGIAGIVYVILKISLLLRTQFIHLIVCDKLSLKSV